MLELAYFELNPDFNPADLGDIAADLMNANAWPTEGVNLLGWWITPDLWGVAVVEVDSAEAAMKDANVWQIKKPGIYKTFRTAIAMETMNVPALMAQLKEKLETPPDS